MAENVKIKIIVLTGFIDLTLKFLYSIFNNKDSFKPDKPKMAKTLLYLYFLISLHQLNLYPERKYEKLLQIPAGNRN